MEGHGIVLVDLETAVIEFDAASSDCDHRTVIRPETVRVIYTEAHRAQSLSARCGVLIRIQSRIQRTYSIDRHARICEGDIRQCDVKHRTARIDQPDRQRRVVIPGRLQIDCRRAGSVDYFVGGTLPGACVYLKVDRFLTVIHEVIRQRGRALIVNASADHARDAQSGVHRNRGLVCGRHIGTLPGCRYQHRRGTVHGMFKEHVRIGWTAAECLEVDGGILLIYGYLVVA